MICASCRAKRCVRCENIIRLGNPRPASGQYCDCQHQQPVPQDGGK